MKAGLGDIVTASVKEATPESAVKAGTVVKCVVVRMRKEARRKDGTYIRFDDNAAVLINDANEPVGNPRVSARWQESCARRSSPRSSRWLRKSGKKMSAHQIKRHTILLRKGDQVKVISGRDAGKSGRVSVRQSPAKIQCWWNTPTSSSGTPGLIRRKNIKGGIIEKEAGINASNVMIVCGSCGKHTRIGHNKLADGSRGARVQALRTRC